MWFLRIAPTPAALVSLRTTLGEKLFGPSILEEGVEVWQRVAALLRRHRSLANLEDGRNLGADLEYDINPPERILFLPPLPKHRGSHTRGGKILEGHIQRPRASLQTDMESGWCMTDVPRCVAWSRQVLTEPSVRRIPNCWLGQFKACWMVTISLPLGSPRSSIPQRGYVITLCPERVRNWGSIQRLGFGWTCLGRAVSEVTSVLYKAIFASFCA